METLRWILIETIFGKKLGYFLFQYLVTLILIHTRCSLLRYLQ